MTQHIFHILVCLVGDIGKYTKSRHIDKIPVVEGTDIHRKHIFIRDDLRGFFHVRRQLKAVREIIGTSGRYIADFWLITGF